MKICRSLSRPLLACLSYITMTVGCHGGQFTMRPQVSLPCIPIGISFVILQKSHGTLTTTKSNGNTTLMNQPTLIPLQPTYTDYLLIHYPSGLIPLQLTCSGILSLFEGSGSLPSSFPLTRRHTLMAWVLRTWITLPVRGSRITDGEPLGCCANTEGYIKKKSQ